MLRTLTPLSGLERNLEQLEIAKKKNRQVSWRMNRADGTVEVKVATSKSLFRWLANRFGHQQEKRALANQCLDVLRNPASEKSIRDRLVTHVTHPAEPAMLSA